MTSRLKDIEFDFW